MSLMETIIENISDETRKTPVDQRDKQRERLLYVYSQYAERYPEYAKELGREEEAFPSLDNQTDLVKILFHGLEFWYSADDLTYLATAKDGVLTTYYAGVSLKMRQAAMDYFDVAHAYGIPCHIEYSKENVEKRYWGYCRVWHFFTQAVEVSMVETLIKQMLTEAKLSPASQIFTGVVDSNKLMLPMGDFSDMPLGSENGAYFVNAETFEPYDTWNYLLSIVSETHDNNVGMITQEMLDLALEVNTDVLHDDSGDHPEEEQKEDVIDDSDDPNEKLIDSITTEQVMELEADTTKAVETMDDNTFDAESVRTFFRRLNHRDFGITELVIINPKGGIFATGFFSDEDTFVKCCSQWNGRGNVYAGRNPRPFDFAEKRGLKTNRMYTKNVRASDRDIEYIVNLSLDIDPIREKDTSSSDEQHETALRFAEMIGKNIGGSIDNSGNGAYLWIPIKVIKIDDTNRESIKLKCKAWESQIREQYHPEEHGLCLDSVYEPSRLKKVIGTLSLKGEVHRLSKFHTPPMMEPHPSMDQTILNINIATEINELENTSIMNIGDQLPQRFQELLNADNELKRHWDTPRDDDDSSKHDWRLGMLCLSRGITDFSDLATILVMNPNGKTKKKNYEEAYIRHAVSAMIKQEKARNEMINPKQIILDIRDNTKSPYEMRSRISRFVYQDLQRKGEFIRTQHDHFYFLQEEKKLMPIPESVDFKSLLNHLYDLVETEQDCQFVLAELKAKCHRYGRKTIVNRFAYFDKASFKLYIDRFDGIIYLLDGETISVIDNGTDGVLFEHDEISEPYVISDQIDGGLFSLYITKRINFEPNLDAGLSIKEQRLLFHTWIWNLLFESIAPTKALLLLYGPKGSGKTSVAKAIGKLIFGSKFDVSSISDDQRDFDALLSNKYLIVLDNLDARKSWLTDRLAKAATGQAIEMRELYTTNRLARYYPKCFVIITARTPQIRQDDVADRLLILNVKRFDKFMPESTLLNDVIQNRNAILSEFFQQLNVCVKRLKNNADKEYSGSFRMADFANFGYKIFNGDEVFIEALTKMDRAQNEFLLEEDFLVEFLNLWLENPHNTNRGVKSLDLLEELKKIAKDKDIEFPYKNPTSLSMRLRNQEKNLQQFFKFKIDIAPGRANLFLFEKKDPNAK